MSEPVRDGVWIRSVARSRGIELDERRSAQVAREAAPILERFDAFVRELRVDDDVNELRARLAAEAGG